MQESFNIQSPSGPTEDPVESVLHAIAQNSIVVVFGLLPLFFIPVAFAPFEYTKSLFAVFGVLIGLIFFSLSVLRSGTIQLQITWPMVAMWGVAGLTVVSALLSGDMMDSFIGDAFGTHTALFVVLLATVMTVPAFIAFTKINVMRMYVLLTVSAVLLGIFHVVRLILGADMVTLGVFTEATDSPIGGWNDLAIFFGLSILLSLVVLEQLPLTRWGKGLFSTVIGLALIMLAVINFFTIWIVLGLVSLVVLMYTLTKERFAEKTISMEEGSSVSIQSIILSVTVFVVSLIFIIGGSAVGSFISNMTNVSYVEVRPSVEATVDIAREVYAENAFVGIGPNRFSDAWRLYKDQSINQTLFWDTDFSSGSGYIPTQFVTGGVFSVLAWVTFFVLFCTAGLRMLVKAVYADRFWYFIGSSSFVAAGYLWGMSFFYNSGAVILLLAAVFSSSTFVAYGALLPVQRKAISIMANKKAAFVMVGVVMIVIVGASSALYYAGRHYASVYAFSNAIQNVGHDGSLEDVEKKIASAFAVMSNDVYARRLASYQLAKMNALIGVAEPTPEQQQAFKSATANGVNAAQLAVKNDPTNPKNWSVLGAVYSLLAAANVEGAADRATEAFAQARTYDPKNPTYSLQEAQLASRIGDSEKARTHAVAAIQLKQNYTDALFFLTQLDIAEGEVENAIVTTRAIISLEPNNPARYYQLGILESSAENNDNAIAAFSRAVALDPNYANARYFLARAYLQANDTDAALRELYVVRDLNPANVQISGLIDQIESGVLLETETPRASEQIEEPDAVVPDDDAVTANEGSDTALIVPVNTVSDNESSATETVEEGNE